MKTFLSIPDNTNLLHTYMFHASFFYHYLLSSYWAIFTFTILIYFAHIYPYLNKKPLFKHINLYKYSVLFILILQYTYTPFVDHIYIIYLGNISSNLATFTFIWQYYHKFPLFIGPYLHNVFKLKLHIMFSH